MNISTILGGILGATTILVIWFLPFLAPDYFGESSAATAPIDKVRYPDQTEDRLPGDCKEMVIYISPHPCAIAARNRMNDQLPFAIHEFSTEEFDHCVAVVAHDLRGGIGLECR